MPLVWWLRQREKQEQSAKRLAREWGLSGALFALAAVIAVIYTGVRLGLMNRTYAFGGLIMSVLLSVPSFYFVLYEMVLRGFPRGRAKMVSDTKV
jgi:hypothetical protein